MIKTKPKKGRSFHEIVTGNNSTDSKITQRRIKIPPGFHNQFPNGCTAKVKSPVNNAYFFLTVKGEGYDKRIYIPKNQWPFFPVGQRVVVNYYEIQQKATMPKVRSKGAEPKDSRAGIGVS